MILKLRPSWKSALAEGVSVVKYSFTLPYLATV